MAPRPSSLPMLAQCGHFVGDQAASDFREAGTDRHAALKGFLQGNMAEWELLDEASQTAVKWAAEYILFKADTRQHPLILEQKVKILYPNFEEVEGTPDAVCGPDLFDFKWRRRDYRAQMAAYSLPILENHFERVNVHVLFGAECKAETFTLDLAEANKIVGSILNRPPAEPEPCDYCGWCAKQLTCPALTGPAKTVALGYSDLEQITNWHPSEMDKPEHLALALFIARKVLKPWIESVEFHASEAMLKKGLKLPGCELVTTRGKKFIADTETAYRASGLPPEVFLKACGVRLNTYTKSPLPGIDKVFKEHNGEASLASAKRAVMQRLGDLVQTGKDVIKIKLTGEAEDGE